MTLARCVMVQGTASGVGKSVLTTALCRVLHEEGFRVAPFKAQNMSLNAAVTREGGEIGRAQAAQAEAAGIAPRVTMNPILLKPEADSRSQVVVLGKATGSTATSTYWRAANPHWAVVRAALDELRSEFDVVVIEGAGSPAELNLVGVDIANMRMARAADASVLLVGDIERGGVFAQLLGTLDLLDSTDRARVGGLVVNKFRGDPSLFDDGLRILTERSGLPVYLLPFADDLGVPSEDGLAPDRAHGVADAPEIAVVAYPHISNHDDLEPLAAAGARIRFVRAPGDFEAPDLIVLPGSKTTIADLGWLRQRRLDQQILELAASGIPVLGICGGFQMLGRELTDRDGRDGSAGTVRGLGLLPVDTAFEGEKRTAQVRARIVNPGFFGDAAGAAFDAYEIHVGRVVGGGPAAAFAELVPFSTGEILADGAVSDDGSVIGTYAHGLFADRPMRNALLASLAARRGTTFEPSELPADPYARLSRWLRASVDIGDLLDRCGLDRRAPVSSAIAWSTKEERSMPRITKVTTRRGDAGETNLGSHERVPKDTHRVQAYGTVDELNSVIGLALAFDLGDALSPTLRRVQNDLLDVGADLAMPPRAGEDHARRVDSHDVLRLEADQAVLQSNLEPLQNFVLPGGSPAVAALHLARTVCRRAEREVVTLARADQINGEVLRYLNRLSDLLFVAARAQANEEATSEVVWRPREGAGAGASAARG